MGKVVERPAAGGADVTGSWSLADALEMYGTKNWGKGYFGINDLGHVVCTPDKTPDRAIDIKTLVDQHGRY